MIKDGDRDDVDGVIVIGSAIDVGFCKIAINVGEITAADARSRMEMRDIS